MTCSPSRALRLRSWLPVSLLLAAAAPAGCAFNSHGDQPGGAGGTGGGATTTTTTTTTSSPTCTPGEAEPCYTGPAGTEGKGLCKAGTHICNADGRTFGACMGDVLPAPENCATAEDEDCNGLAFDDSASGCKCEPGIVSACDTGKLGICGAGTHVCDPDGTGHGTCEDVVTPTFEDCDNALDENCDGVATCTGAAARGGAFGSTGAGDDVAFAVAVEPSGGFVIAGVAEGVTEGFDVTTGKLLLRRYDASGALLWSRSSGDGAYATARGVAIDPSGNIFVIGEFTGGLDIGDGKSVSVGVGDIDVFLAKLDGNGVAQWIKSWGDTEVQVGLGVAADAQGNALITGGYRGGINFGGGGSCNVGASAGNSDTFVAKIGPTGSCTWGRRLGDGADQVARAIAVTPEGDAVVAGYFAGTMDFGGAGNALTSAGLADAFIAKIPAAGGNAIWVRRFGDAQDQVATGLAVDPQGNIALVGAYRGTIDLGNGPFTNADTTFTTDDVFVAKLAPTGAAVWSKGFGDDRDQYATAVTIDAGGHVTVGGMLWGNINLGGGVLSNFDATDTTADIFLAKLGSGDGKHLWSRRHGDAAEQRVRAAGVDAMGNLVIAGGFRGGLGFGVPVGVLASTGGYDVFAVGLDP